MIIIPWLLLAVASWWLRLSLPYLSKYRWLSEYIRETVHVIYETYISRVSLGDSSPEGLWAPSS
jgi:hypothetical protein